MSNQIVKFVFQGDELDVIKQGDKLWVSVRRVCESLGVDPWNQQLKLKEKPWAVTVLVTATGPDGKKYENLCVDLDSLPMWLATIDLGRVAPEVRPKLIAYQREAAKALRDYFFGGVAVNPRILELEILCLRQKTAVEILMIGRDALDRVYVERAIQHGVAIVQGTEPPGGPRLIDVSSYLQGKGLDAAEVRRIASRFGRILSALYRARFGEPPKKLPRLINGAERLVSSYTEEHLTLFEQAFEALGVGKEEAA